LTGAVFETMLSALSAASMRNWIIHPQVGSLQTLATAGVDEETMLFS
jgi:hypothetical protein